MPQQPKPEFYLKPNFPYDEVERIILEIAEELRRRSDSIGVVDSRRKTGLDDPGERVMHSVETTLMKNPMKTIEIQRWAAKQYFTLLLIDQCRLGYFRDHGMCDPQP